MSIVLKRGEKQIITLRLLNATTSPNFTLEEIVESLMEQTGLNEDSAKHTIRYMVKFQDRIDSASGKNKTLRDQNKIIQPSWYSFEVPNPDDPNLSEKDRERHRLARNQGLKYVDFPLPGPAMRKTPVKSEKKTGAPMTPERLEMFRTAARSLSAKQATKEIERLAREGAHHFMAPDVIPESKFAPEAMEDDEDLLDANFETTT